MAQNFPPAGKASKYHHHVFTTCFLQTTKVYTNNNLQLDS